MWLKRVCTRTAESTPGEQADISDPKSSTGGDREAEIERGQLENVKWMSVEKRQDVVVKLRSACEMALTLVYSDHSTQLHEISVDTKVVLSFR